MILGLSMKPGSQYTHFALIVALIWPSNEFVSVGEDVGRSVPMVGIN